MKKSEKPTPYIYIRAYTRSEWDSCDFAIIKISKAWLYLLGERLELLEDFRDRLDFYSHEYWDAPYNYFVHTDEDVQELLKDNTFDWCYIDTNPAELQLLKRPEAKLATHQLVVTGDGYAHFTAIGKSSEEEYWTAEFGICDLLKGHKNHIADGKEENHA